MIVVLLGPPGSGKGTVAQRIEKEKGWKQVATGDLLREIAKSGSEKGLELDKIMKSGGLVPDETVTEILKEHIEKEKLESFVLDGYPRTLKQAELLDELLQALGKKIDLVLLISCPDDVIVERISSRRVCPQCHAVYGLDVPPKEEGVCDKCGAELIQREDEKEETVRKRIEVYRERTAPLIDYYSKKGLIKEIDGSKKLEEVMAQVFKAFE